MRLALEVPIVAHAILAAAQWRHAARWLYDPPVWGYCGNVVSEPFALLLNAPCPIAAGCAAGLACRCFKERRWPWHAVAALMLFVAASAGLVYEAGVLRDYGFERGRVWWLPWR